MLSHLVDDYQEATKCGWPTWTNIFLRFYDYKFYISVAGGLMLTASHCIRLYWIQLLSIFTCTNRMSLSLFYVSFYLDSNFIYLITYQLTHSKLESLVLIFPNTLSINQSKWQSDDRNFSNFIRWWLVLKNYIIIVGVYFCLLIRWWSWTSVNFFPLTLKNKRINDKILQNVGRISTTLSFILLFFGVNGGNLTEVDGLHLIKRQVNSR